MPTSPDSTLTGAAELDLVFGALADATRRAILERLMSGEVSVGALTSGFDISQPAISNHLRVLERAGLISRSRQGTMRLSHLDASPLQTAHDWLAPYRAYWEESFDRLDDLLAEQRAASAPASASDEAHQAASAGTARTDSHEE